MPSVTYEFKEFSKSIGLGSDHTEALWNAGIHSPQELGSMRVEDLQGVCNNAFLLNQVHPILQKYVFNISTASDPYKKAFTILKKHAMKEDSDEEMDTSNGVSSDAAAYVTDQREESTPRTRTETPPGENTINNSESFVSSAGHGMTQSNVQLGSHSFGPSKKGGMTPSISITGGNFVQANILGKGPVTYNNTNTVISTTMGSTGGTGISDLKKLRSEVLNESFVVNGNLVRLQDVAWNDGANFWIDGDIAIPRADMESYKKSFASGEIYQVRNYGNSRALVINNSVFNPSTRMPKRTGAERDGENVKTVLTRLGFKVNEVLNKPALDIKQDLREFATSPKNTSADMVAVYIGSHGERDKQGNDSFVGADGDFIKFEEVKELFSPTNAPFLIGKPKIFFLQFCRQEADLASTPRAIPLSDLEADSMPLAGEEDKRCMDLLCVYATLAGNKAYRDTKDGSWFVSGLVRILKEHSHKDDLLSMLTRVNNSVSTMEGKEGSTRAIQISEVVHNLRKKVYFWPGMQL